MSNLKDFVRLAPIPIALIDADNRYVLASDEYKKFYQLPDEIVGSRPDELFPYFKNEWYDYHQQGFDGKHLKNKGLAEEIKLPSGAMVYVKWEIHPWVRGGEVAGILTTIVPVTDYIRSIIELENTIRAIAHDITGAIVQVSNLADIIFLEEEYKTSEFIPELRAAIEYAEKLIREFHRLVEVGREDVNLEPVDIRALSEGMFRAKFVAGEFEFDSEVPNKPVLLTGDPDKLSRLFGNLFSNAAKYRSSEIAPKVWVKLRSKLRGFWEVEVSDNSDGFDSEKYGALVVKPCERLDKTKEGTGLGLAIAQKIAEKHGTSLEFESKPGEGVTVRFSLREWGKVRE